MERGATRRDWLRVIAVSMVGTLAACAAPAPTPTAAPPKPGPAASPAATVAAAPTKAPAPTTAPAPTQVPAKPKQLTKVTITQSIHALSFAPMYVARAKGLFSEEGIDLDWQLVSGGSPAVAALTSGSVQIAGTGSNDLVAALLKQLPLLGVAGVTSSLVLDTVVSKKFLQDRKIQRSAPLDQRLQALKGAKFGTASLGGLPDRLARYLLVRAGYTLDDIEVQRIGGTPELLAAMREGLIDGFLLSAPAGLQVEKEGFGEILIPFSDIPEFNEATGQVLFTTTEFADKNPQTVESVCRAMARACNLLLDKPQEATKLLAEAFKEVSPDLLDRSITSTRTGYPRDARMTEKAWSNAVNVFQRAGVAPSAVPAAEGTWWTNRFIKNIPKD